MRRYRRHPNLSGEQVLLLNKMESEWTLRGYGRKTQKSYVGYLPAFPEVERDVQDDTRSAVRSNPRMGKTRRCSCYTLTVV